MKIKPTPNYALNCNICIQGKMSNDKNKTLDRKVKILALLHSDLTEPIQPLGKERYVLNFIDDNSGLIMLYFFKHMASAYIRNRCYNGNTRKTPYESFTG